MQLREKDILGCLPLLASVLGNTYGVHVRIGGADACTDGNMIQLPSLPVDCGEELLLFAGMALSMTAIEYIAGIVSLKFMHIRLWDYSKQWGNIQGLICPAFSVLWAAVSAVYYFCVHPYILDALDWLSRNLAFSFVIGFFFGVFTIDLVYSAKLVSRIRKFADEHDVVIKVENLKAHIRQRQEERREKYSFLFAYRSRSELLEHLREAQETWEERHRK